jgi:hypothetical protein
MTIKIIKFLGIKFYNEKIILSFPITRIEQTHLSFNVKYEEIFLDNIPTKCWNDKESEVN